MNDHMRQSQAELNDLLKEYWKLRHATGNEQKVLSDMRDANIHPEVYMETLANKLGMQVTSI